MDFYEISSVAAISHRVRRLADRLSAEDAAIYKSFDIDFKPKWMPIVSVIGGVQKSLINIAKETGLSHSSVSVMAKELIAEGFIESVPNPDDGRKNDVKLTEKGVDLRRQLNRMMLPKELAVNSILNHCTQNLWLALQEWEDALDEKSLNQRVDECKERLARLAPETAREK